MNALAIDCASRCLVVAAQKGADFFQVTMDMGLRQSEKLLPVIDGVLSHLSLSPAELDLTAVTQGPGSFTGLRLGLSSLKALTLSHGIPLYGLDSLAVYAYPYRHFCGTVVPLVESKDNEFFFCTYRDGIPRSEIRAASFDTVMGSGFTDGKALVCGPGSVRFMQAAREQHKDDSLLCFEPSLADGRTMLRMAQEMRETGAGSLQDYDGPLYYKKSEAELVLEAKQGHSPT